MVQSLISSIITVPILLPVINRLYFASSTNLDNRLTLDPAPLKMNNLDLPWVESATHLGYEIHQMCDMSYDCKVKKAEFIKTSTDIRETFSFGHPDQVLSAITLYACHFYGAMLWDLSSDICGQVYRSWNTCVKLVWDVPRSTHTYLVDNLLATNHTSIKKLILSRYVKFHKNLLKSKSDEVRILANIVSRDIRSVTGKNLDMIERESGQDPWKTNSFMVKENLSDREVPEQDMWRLPLLCQYLNQRREMETAQEDTGVITDLIDSLCSS